VVDAVAADGVAGCPVRQARENAGAGYGDAGAAVEGDDIARSGRGSTDGVVMSGVRRPVWIGAGLHADAIAAVAERSAGGGGPDAIPEDCVEQPTANLDAVSAVAGNDVAGGGRRATDDVSDHHAAAE